MTFIHIVLYTIKFSFNSIWYFFEEFRFLEFRRFLPSLRRLLHMCGSFKRRRQIYFQFHSDVFDTMRKNHNDTRIWDHISWHVTIFTLKNNNCLFAFSGFTFCNFFHKNCDFLPSFVIYVIWCVFPMIVVSKLHLAEFGQNDHLKDAPHFIRFWGERISSCK